MVKKNALMLYISRKSKINVLSTTLKLYEGKNEKRIIQQNYSFLVTQEYLKISRIFGLAKLFLIKVYVKFSFVSLLPIRSLI